MSEPEETSTVMGRKMRKVPPPNFPNADDIVADGLRNAPRLAEAVDIMLVNPPSPDGGIWIRSQHRVGRRSRENMVWPQVSLAQMAALLHPTYTVKVVDAIAERMSWPAFTEMLERHDPSYYLTQVTAPTLENDMYGAFLAKARGARTIAFGTHVTPVPRETMRAYPALDFVLYGEPDLTIRDLIDHLEGRIEERPENIRVLFTKHLAGSEQEATEVAETSEHARLSSVASCSQTLKHVRGLVWRRDGEIVMNAPRPFIADLDDLPMPMHELLPLKRYRVPMIKGPFTFIVPSRGCPAGCVYCIKHVSYQRSVRVRSPASIMAELWKLKKLGINNIHMYADLFTVDREQVMGLCDRMIAENIGMRWTCNSRVDSVDEVLLERMVEAGCHLIAWGLESGSEAVLKRARKGVPKERAIQSLSLARKAGIKNWGYFIIGLPGETEDTIRETIAFAKRLPLHIALFHIVAPHPGTPLFFEVVKNGWFRPGTRWEQVDMDKETVIDYPELSAERIGYWQRRAFREWAFRPGPIFAVMRMLCSDVSMLRSLVRVATDHAMWAFGLRKET
ncbi:MAG: radical SAM protein [Kiritimatiellae bacterium]|nr:radical SAM protein [Kiritimatiellia bacterium]